MTFENAQAILSCLTYKPGWFIHGIENETGIEIQVVPPQWDDTSGLRSSVTLHFYKSVRLTTLNETSFLFAVLRVCELAERHECQEWFRYNGKLVVDPHDETWT